VHLHGYSSDEIQNQNHVHLEWVELWKDSDRPTYQQHFLLHDTFYLALLETALDHHLEEAYPQIFHLQDHHHPFPILLLKEGQEEDEEDAHLYTAEAHKNHVFHLLPFLFLVEGPYS
jgi:hypothetical protein